jgi:hypothetical protein
MLTISFPKIKIYGPTDIEEFKMVSVVGARVQGTFSISDWYIDPLNALALTVYGSVHGAFLRVDITDISPYVLMTSENEERHFPYVVVVDNPNDVGVWK